jgi:hypothetical protein
MEMTASGHNKTVVSACSIYKRFLRFPEGLTG